MSTFTDNLKKLIKERGITQKKFLLDLGLNINAIGDWTKYGNTPKGDTLQKIANYFSVSVDYLLGKSENAIDDSVLDRVNSIEPDILEACDGNLNTAEKWQEERDDLTSRLEAAHEIYKQAQKKQPTEKQAAAIDKIKNMSPDELQQAEVFLDFIISKREDPVDE